MSVAGKRVIVTGGKSGLGAACALFLLKNGAKVAVWDRPTVSGGPKDGDLAYIDCEMTEKESVERALAETVRRIGGVDVVVNCDEERWRERVMGTQGVHRVDSFQRVFRRNVFGTFLVSRCVAGQMARQSVDKSGDRGVIILVSDISHSEGISGQVALSSSKAAILGMLLPMARDLSLQQIRVVALSVGGVWTSQQGKGEIEEMVGGVVLVGREGRDQEFGEAVASIVRCSFLNACEVRLDGGLRMPNL